MLHYRYMFDLIPSLKRCSRCREYKAVCDDLSVSGFQKDRSVPGGYKSACRQCRSLENKENTRRRSEPVRRLSPEEQLASDANRYALKALVERHKTEFMKLVASERRRLGFSPEWISLSSKKESA